jgi:hypothetical protein
MKHTYSVPVKSSSIDVPAVKQIGRPNKLTPFNNCRSCDAGGSTTRIPCLNRAPPDCFAQRVYDVCLFPLFPSCLQQPVEISYLLDAFYVLTAIAASWIIKDTPPTSTYGLSVSASIPKDSSKSHEKGGHRRCDWTWGTANIMLRDLGYTKGSYT